MILYVNGCSHTAAADAVIPGCFAIDDGRHGIDRRPHPINLAASWCSHVANQLNSVLVCEAESGGSNDRIVRTTKQWISSHPDNWADLVVLIQWTTWERQEWLHEGIWYQVNASGIDWVPEALKDRYKKFVVTVDWDQATKHCHQQAWLLHEWLLHRRIKHLFFSGHSTFSDVEQQLPWGKYYIAPYDRDQSYHNWLLANGGNYANPQSYHFDAKSHRLWAEYVLQYIDRNCILEPNNEISSN